jgi:hypothetical protein
MYGNEYLFTVPLYLPTIKLSGPAAILQIRSVEPRSGFIQDSLS